MYFRGDFTKLVLVIWNGNTQSNAVPVPSLRSLEQIRNITYNRVGQFIYLE